MSVKFFVSSAYAAGGLPQTAPEGLVPLDSHSPPAGGTEGQLVSIKIAASSAYAASGLPQTAPEGLVPLDSHSSPAGGTEEQPRQRFLLANTIPGLADGNGQKMRNDNGNGRGLHRL